MKIIQFTDTHFFDDPSARLAGINTRESYQAVKLLALRQHKDIACILHTGDICQEPGCTAYRWFVEDVGRIGVPVYCVPGNHDDPILMQHVMGLQSVYYKNFVDVGGWRLIMLSTAVYGSASGRLTAEALNQARECIHLAGKRPILVCLHHNPLPMGSHWLDSMTVDCGETLMENLLSFPHVKAVVHGHVHQASDRSIGHIRLLSAPSTCFQFTPKSKGFSLDQTTPGYRWLILKPDGSLETGIERLPNVPQGFIQETPGY